jgi:hypothetical protein
MNASTNKKKNRKCRLQIADYLIWSQVKQDLLFQFLDMLILLLNLSHIKWWDKFEKQKPLEGTRNLCTKDITCSSYKATFSDCWDFINMLNNLQEMRDEIGSYEVNIPLSRNRKKQNQRKTKHVPSFSPPSRKEAKPWKLDDMNHRHNLAMLF